MEEKEIKKEETKKPESRMFDRSFDKDLSGIKEGEEDFSSEHVEHKVLTQEEAENFTKGNKDYDGTGIQVLEGLEPVRQRPGMYIGSTSARGLHHLVREIVDNSVDEALAGFCKHIQVSLLPNDEVMVEDDGRGIPTDIVEKTGKSGVETVYTVLHAGGKFDGSTVYKVSGGLHGVGASVVNALSEFVRVKVFKNGKIYLISFENGGHTTKEGLQIVGECSPEKTGTQVVFKPDRTIFTETTTFNYSDIRDYLRQTAYLNKGLRITLYDKRNPEELAQDSFYFEGGISEYVTYLNQGKEVVFDSVIYCESEAEDVYVECAFQPNKTSIFSMRSFCNNIFTAGGGTHEEGFRLALGRELNSYFRYKGWLKDNDENFNYEDLTEGLTVVLSVKHPNPQYEGQVKDKLGNQEVRKIVSSIVGDGLKQWLMEHPKEGKLFFERALSAFKGRKAAERARKNVMKQSGVSIGMPDKLADCISKNPEERELFIVEGNSAGGSAKDGRDSQTQAILPLRGKILNVEKANASRIDKNQEIANLIQAIGGGSGEQFDVSKIRYHKVIIMTDADVDGSHIRILLLTFFYRYMKPLIEQGYVYVACPPLYQLKYNNHDYYCFKEEELVELRKKLPENAKYKLQRYKGLGEMDAHQLAETTMEKEHRHLLKVTIEDALEANNALTDLMGEAVQPRKDYIQANAKFVKNLDI